MAELSTRFDDVAGESVPAEPVAIVGMAFRLPGDLGDPGALWQALTEGRDLISRIPEDRWSTTELEHPRRSEPGRAVTFSAGVLSRIDEFDAAFFGISPREAAWMDPQQRLLLELSWEAMENAGVPPSSLAGSRCAVYLGISSLDYGTRGLDDLASMTSHSMTGNTLSIAANRLSYIFDLHGPSLAVDTACSSSLVALHHACRALQTGEAPVALVGGVNLLLHPYPFVGFSKASMLSADGRCKPFDAAANGYVRAEGGVVLLLKPLKDALAAGDRIEAVILGTGVNTDGARKSGITIPSPEGQMEVMRAVLARTGVAASDVDYIEMHGTGTPVGDPIECTAVGSVFGAGRPQPLPVGSVKGNLGHLEPASGLAGLLKAVLVLQYREVPPQAHLRELNPHIDFQALNVAPVRALQPLEKAGPLRVGVNSFGFGGVNAHVLLQEHRPQPAAPVAVVRRPAACPLWLSARSPDALRELARAYAQRLAQACGETAYDLVHATALTRDRLSHRLGLWVEDGPSAAKALQAHADGREAAGVVVENVQPGLDGSGVAFVYSGNGSQWVGMGLRLLDESPRFARYLAALDARMRPVAGFSILEELRREGEASRMADTVVAQPLLFAIQVALTEVLAELEVKPRAVTGHSVGEVAAAWAAGALDLDAAIRVIVARSRAQGETRGAGRMAAVGLSAADMQHALDTLPLGKAHGIVVAGINSPGNVTVSGPLSSLLELESQLPPGVFFKLLDLDYAFHSPAMDPVRERVLADLADLAPGASPRAGFVSTVTGGPLEAAALGRAAYWWDNIREPVRFEPAVAALQRLGCGVFLEIGPHAILHRYVQETLAAAGDAAVKPRTLPLLRKGADGWAAVRDTAMRVLLLAGPADLRAWFACPARPVRLPNYPWQRERHWHGRSAESAHLYDRTPVHPLLGCRVPQAGWTWECHLDPVRQAWLGDHRIGGAVVFPGTGYAELALAAAREWLPQAQTLAIEELDIVAPIVFDGEHARTMRLELDPRDGRFTIRSRQRLAADEWMVHAAGRLLQYGPAPQATLPAVEAGIETDAATHYRLAEAIGLHYGPAFRTTQWTRSDGERLTGEVQGPPDLPQAGYLLQPALLDGCFQGLIAVFRQAIESGHGVAVVPVKIGRIACLSAGGPPVRFSARILRRGTRSIVADFDLFDAEGRTLASLSTCRFRAAPLGQDTQQAVDRWRMLPWLQPHPSETARSWLPATPELLAAMRQPLQAQAEARRVWFKETLPLLEALTTSFVFEAAQTMTADPGAWAQAMASADAYVTWARRLLEEEGLLVRDGAGWRLAEPDALPPAAEIWRTLLREHPEAVVPLVTLGRVGRHLPELLQAPASRAAMLQSLRRAAVSDRLVDDPASAGVAAAIGGVLAFLADARPAGRRLRVLEIASSATPTLARLACMAPDTLDYLHVAVAAPGPHGQPEADGEITLDPVTWQLQGADEPSGQDLIIVHQALHRAAQPRAALARLGRWLAAGGCLLLAERHADRCADLVGGLDPAWWVETAQGPQSPLMPAAAWMDLLQAEGYVDVVRQDEPAADGLAEGAYLVMARRPSEAAAGDAAPAPAAWWLWGDGASRAWLDGLRRQLVAQGQQVQVVDDEQAVPPAGLQHVVYARGWAADVGEADRLVAEYLALAQGLSRHEGQGARLWLLGCGGAPVDIGLAPRPAQAALWGLGRVIMNEMPGLGCTLLDLGEAPEADWPRVARELLQPDGSRECVLRPGARHTLVMRRDELAGLLPAPQGATDEAPRYRLDFLQPGQLRHLQWMPAAARGLADDEVEVRVHAAGLNFRDVMYAMGMLPDEALENGFAGPTLGLEFAGVVTRVGAQVRDVAPGDRVMGFGPACLASHVVTRAHAVARMPQGWSFQSAATVPTVFFTVYYALTQLADLQPGERVLIHGGAGGVGIAAIQLARHLGAEVFASAGSEDKRDFVRLLGADHVLDSRSLAFADDILALTGGRGVDVVLNSLAGEAMRRSLAVLAPFGRFLELGKRDFFENTAVGLRSFKDNISYFGIDADQLMTRRPQLATRLFGELLALFHDGVLAPLPVREFDADGVVDAFRTMQQARHIGKVVVRLDVPPAGWQAARPAVPALPPGEGTWLVTGGLSGFGLACAQWLARRGVRHLALVSRRAADTPGARDVVQALRACGAQVQLHACDVADADAVHRLVKELAGTMPPLCGVLHAAAVYDDGLLQNLTPERVRAVLQPKLLGAWHLHEATRQQPLQHFVLFSSIATYIGNPGQGSYVAANTGLEALAALRHRQGLPATCIAWGPIGDAGYLERHQEVRDSLAQRLGKPPLTAAQALGELEALLARPQACASAPLDWAALARWLPSAGIGRFALLNQGLDPSAAGTDDTDFRALVAGKPDDEVLALATEWVRREVAQILAIAPERIEASTPLHDLGMDSLMAVELALGLEQRFGVQLPTMMLNDAPTPDKVARRILERLRPREDAAADRAAEMVQQIASQHGEAVDEASLQEILKDSQTLAERGVRLTA